MNWLQITSELQKQPVWQELAGEETTAGRACSAVAPGSLVLGKGTGTPPGRDTPEAQGWKASGQPCDVVHRDRQGQRRSARPEW